MEAEAEARAAVGQLDRAISILQEVCGVYGGRALAHFKLGELYEQAGRRAEAREAYVRCVSLWARADPDYPYPAQARARLMALSH